MKVCGALGLALGLAVAPPAAAQSLGEPNAGRLVAEAQCADCHAIRAAQKFSLDLDAPHFEDVANRPGMTAAALRSWLRSSHPTMPNIILNPTDTDDVVAYILSLKAR